MVVRAAGNSGIMYQRLRSRQAFLFTKADSLGSVLTVEHGCPVLRLDDQINIGLNTLIELPLLYKSEMSRRISDILEILTEVSDGFDSEIATNIANLRVQAANSVARRREVNIRSVADKYIRQLRPRIKTTDEFDDLLAKWL